MILALEFSSNRRSVALSCHGDVLAEAVQHTDSRATNAFGLVETVLAKAKIAREEINVLATGLGPGSYTGIRVAIAIAQGWQLARRVKLMGVSSAECMAAQVQAEQLYGRVNVVIDAQRGEFYLATWEISAAERRQVLPLKIVPAATIAEQAGICVGPQADKILFPTARMVALLAASHGVSAPDEGLEPIYLREGVFTKALPAKTF